MHILLFTLTGLILAYLANLQLGRGKSQLKIDLSAGVIGSVASGLLASSLEFSHVAPNIICAREIVIAAAGGLWTVFMAHAVLARRRR